MADRKLGKKKEMMKELLSMGYCLELVLAERKVMDLAELLESLKVNWKELAKEQQLAVMLE